MKLKVVFLKDGPDGFGRRAYNIHIRKQIGTVADLKKLISEEFGYDIRH